MPQPCKVTEDVAVFKIYWTLTDFCNHHCYYCPSQLNSGDYATGRKLGFPTDQEIEKFLDNLPTLIGNRKFQLAIGGGEPTLHPMLPAIIKKVKEITPNANISIVTNGTRNSNFWKTILPLNSITMSLHPEYIELKDRMLENAKIIKESGTLIAFSLSLDPTRWDIVKDLYETFSEKFPGVVLPKVLNYLYTPTRGNYEYSKEQWEDIKKWTAENWQPRSNTITTKLHFDDNTAQLFNLAKWTINGWNKYKGWECDSGYNGVNIRPNGEVVNSLCNVETLGRIDSFKLKDKPLICPYEYCACPLDLFMTKRKLV
jgi:MoaA/NifB/PqqE/SkfB family radical SAM enzyme